MIALILLFPGIIFSQYVETLYLRSGEKFNVTKNKKTNSIHRAYGKFGNFYLKTNSERGLLNEKNIQSLSKEFLKQYPEILKIKSDELNFIRVDTGNGCHYIKLQQVYNNIPIYRSSVGFTIEKDGEVYLIGTDVHPEIKISTIPALSKEKALEIANSDFLINQEKIGEMNIHKNNLIIFPKENEKTIDY